MEKKGKNGQLKNIGSVEAITEIATLIKEQRINSVYLIYELDYGRGETIYFLLDMFMEIKERISNHCYKWNSDCEYDRQCSEIAKEITKLLEPIKGRLDELNEILKAHHAEFKKEALKSKNKKIDKRGN